MLAKKWWVVYLTVPDGHPFVCEMYSDDADKQEVMNCLSYKNGFAILDILEAN